MRFYAVIICAVLFLSIGEAVAQPANAPRIATTLHENTLQLSWNRVPGATGYRLYYAPYPNAETVGFADLGDINYLNGALPTGSAYYVAISGFNSGGEGPVSNVASFQVEQEASGAGDSRRPMLYLSTSETSSELFRAPGISINLEDTTYRLLRYDLVTGEASLVRSSSIGAQPRVQDGRFFTSQTGVNESFSDGDWVEYDPFTDEQIGSWRTTWHAGGCAAVIGNTIYTYDHGYYDNLFRVWRRQGGFYRTESGLSPEQLYERTEFTCRQSMEGYGGVIFDGTASNDTITISAMDVTVLQPDERSFDFSAAEWEPSSFTSSGYGITFSEGDAYFVRYNEGQDFTEIWQVADLLAPRNPWTARRIYVIDGRPDFFQADGGYMLYSDRNSGYAYLIDQRSGQRYSYFVGENFSNIALLVVE